MLAVAPGAVLESAAAVATGPDTEDPAACASALVQACERALAPRRATGRWLTLALTLPAADRHWVEPFATRLGELARDRELALIGGDTTAGPRTVTLVLHGLASPGRGAAGPAR